MTALGHPVIFQQEAGLLVWRVPRGPVSLFSAPQPRQRTPDVLVGDEDLPAASLELLQGRLRGSPGFPSLGDLALQGKATLVAHRPSKTAPGFGFGRADFELFV